MILVICMLFYIFMAPGGGLMCSNEDCNLFPTFTFETGLRVGGGGDYKSL